MPVKILHYIAKKDFEAALVANPSFWYVLLIIPPIIFTWPRRHEFQVSIICPEPSYLVDEERSSYRAKPVAKP